MPHFRLQQMTDVEAIEAVSLEQYPCYKYERTSRCHCVPRRKYQEQIAAINKMAQSAKLPHILGDQSVN